MRPERRAEGRERDLKEHTAYRIVPIVGLAGCVIALLVLIVAILSLSGNAAERLSAETEANRTLLRDIRTDLNVVVAAGVRRDCAIAQQIADVIMAFPDPDPLLVRKMDVAVEEACRVVVVRNPGGEPTVIGGPDDGPEQQTPQPASPRASPPASGATPPAAGGSQSATPPEASPSSCLLIVCL